MEENKIKVAFSATNKRLESLIPSPKESENKAGKKISWGENDDYPIFLYKLYTECPILSTILNTSSDYVVGNGVKSNIERFKYSNSKGETWDSLLNRLSFDYLCFGICYVQIIRDSKGEPAEFYHLDARYVRSDEDNETFYYNKEFGKKYGRSSKTLVYPKFNPDAKNIASSIICVKTQASRSTYGFPIWAPAIKSVLVETKIDNFHLSEIDNNFSASAIISLNNGIPTDEQADDLEKAITEKLCGAENAARFMLIFANGKDNATTVERLNTDDFDKRYESLANKTQKQIFASFGASPVVFGVEKDGSGFNDEDYQQAFKLYNRTRIQPIQMKLIDMFDRVLGVEGSLTITPFSIDFSKDADNNEQVN